MDFSQKIMLFPVQDVMFIEPRGPIKTVGLKKTSSVMSRWYICPCPQTHCMFSEHLPIKTMGSMKTSFVMSNWQNCPPWTHCKFSEHPHWLLLSSWSNSSPMLDWSSLHQPQGLFPLHSPWSSKFSCSFCFAAPLQSFPLPPSSPCCPLRIPLNLQCSLIWPKNVHSSKSTAKSPLD